MTSLHGYGSIPSLDSKTLWPVNKEEGVVIAVAGLDSAGKTVVVNRLVQWLQPRVDVQQMHYGYARATLVTRALRGVLVLRSALVGERSSQGDTAASDTAPGEVCPAGWFASVRYLALAHERQRLLVSAMRAARRGSVVVVERWYSLAAGKMDSPRLDPAAGNAVKRWMARLEHRLYSGSPDPDLILHLQVDEAVAIERNRGRTGVIDDTDAQISARFRLHSNLPYRCDRQIEIDNNGEIDQTMEQIRQSVLPLLPLAPGEA